MGDELPMSSLYTVRVGETIRDVVINGTGRLTDGNGNPANWDAIAAANAFTTWTPLLIAGQQVIIPDNISIDTNTVKDKQSYPASNYRTANAMDILETVWGLLTDRWILKDGVWDDSGIWIDTANWKDNP